MDEWLGCEPVVLVTTDFEEEANKGFGWLGDDRIDDLSRFEL